MSGGSPLGDNLTCSPARTASRNRTLPAWREYIGAQAKRFNPRLRDPEVESFVFGSKKEEKNIRLAQARRKKKSLCDKDGSGVGIEQLGRRCIQSAVKESSAWYWSCCSLPSSPANDSGTETKKKERAASLDADHLSVSPCWPQSQLHRWRGERGSAPALHARCYSMKLSRFVSICPSSALWNISTYFIIKKWPQIKSASNAEWAFTERKRVNQFIYSFRAVNYALLCVTVL